MLQKRRLLTNGLAAFVQVVVTGAVFLLLYRFAKDKIGIEYFGVWSLVLATTSVGSIANLGMAPGAVKFVAMYLARDRQDQVVRIVQTATLTLCALVGLALLGLYPILVMLIRAALEPRLLPLALEILPYAMASLWLVATAGALQGCIDGHQRVDLRSGLISTASVAYLLLALVLVPKNGLVGLAQAQVLQAALLLLGSWLVLKRLVPALPLLPWRWNRSVFREMFSYSVNAQFISVTVLLFEPLAKILMMTFGGAAAAGYFEFASRMVMQLRALIVTSHQVIVPTIADLHERQPDIVQVLYRKSFQIILYIVLLSVPIFIAVTPIISQLWLGSDEPVFILFASLLFVGWALNTLSGPAYFGYLGIGRLRWNVVSHLVMGILNGGLGWLLGSLYGGTGVVVAYVTALLIGSMITLVAYQRDYRVPFSDLAPPHVAWVGLAATVSLAAAIWAHVTLRAP